MQPLDPLTIPLDGRNLIEASAGTGKTYTLVLLYLRHLIERQRRVQDILVVTFTKAATAELCDRIRGRIRQALDLLGSEQTDQDPLLGQLLACHADPSEARQRLEEALMDMDEAAIYTIHGFCQRILQDHAFAADSPLVKEFLENEDALRLEIIQDYWRRSFYHCPADQAAWVSEQFEQPAALLATLSPLLAQRDAVVVPQIEASSLKQRRQDLLMPYRQIRVLWLAHRHDLETLLASSPALKRNQDAYRLADQLPALLADMDQLTAGESLPWSCPYRLHLLTSTGLAANCKKGKEPPEHPLFTQFTPLFDGLRQLLQMERMAILLDARDYLVDELTTRKGRQGWFSFDDLLLQVDGALGRPDGHLVQQLRQRYPVALVDEFQDTDPIQYRIFSRIYPAEQGNLTLIGDPKQAIYAFRGADIYTYLHARQQCPAQRRFTMATNYRSSAPMVKAINTLFGAGNPFMVEAIDAPRLTAAGQADSTPLLDNHLRLPPLTATMLPRASSAANKPLSLEAARSAAVTTCAAKIQQLLELPPTLGDRDLTAGDIAVLVRTHHEATLIQDGLRRLQIGSVLFSRQSIFASEQAEQLFLVLQALINPADRIAVATALATDLFGYQGHDLHLLQQDSDRWDQIQLRMHGYQQLWQNQGIFALCQRLFNDSSTVQRLTAYGDGDRCLTNFLHLAELLQQQSAQSHGLSALLHWFNRQLANPVIAEDERQLRLENDEQLIQIVTMHKAKGLEYPVVFLPFVWASRTARTNRQDLLIYHRKDQRIINLDSQDPQGQEAQLLESQAEDMRLLYVALTRAVHACFFTWGSVRQMEQGAMNRLLGMDTRQQGPADLTQVQDRLNAQDPLLVIEDGLPEHLPAPHRASVVPTVSPAIFTGTIPSTWQITSYSRLLSGHDHQPRRDEDHDEPSLDDPEVFSIHTFPRGAHAGTCLHQILEAVTFDGSPEDWRQIVALHLEQAGIEPAWLPVVHTWLQDLVQTPLPCGCTLATLDPQDLINEMGFLFPLQDLDSQRFNRLLTRHGLTPLALPSFSLAGMMKGFIDLTFHWEGRYYIVDYKSNHLGPQQASYDHSSLQEVMERHRYDLQYLIYSVAVHRYLSHRLADYSYERHFGGINYLFLRGMRGAQGRGEGIFNARPSQALIHELDNCFAGGSTP